MIHRGGDQTEQAESVEWVLDSGRQRGARTGPAGPRLNTGPDNNNLINKKVRNLPMEIHGSEETGGETNKMSNKFLGFSFEEEV